MKILKKGRIKKVIISSFALLCLLVIIPASRKFFKKKDTSERDKVEKKETPPQKKSNEGIHKKEDFLSLDEQKGRIPEKSRTQIQFNQVHQKTSDENLVNKNQNALPPINSLSDSTSKVEKTAGGEEFPDQAKKEQNLKNERSKQSRWMKGDDIYNFYNSIEKEEGVLLLDPLYLGDLVNKKGERRVSSIRSLVRKKLDKNKLIFLPANQGNFHWSLFVYEKETKTFHHYDSLSSLNVVYFSPLCEEILRNVSSSSSIKQEKAPQQFNGNDCGIYVMAVTDFLIKRYKDNPSKMNWEINDSEVREIHKNVKKIKNDFFELEIIKQ